ncbi:M48 metallopeptidase family protein [Microlunatus ginsengisoli]|uniref:M48 family metallopeptidase n=1 Tax=Microlunatus ginsengisoli TaxID=363863 RepID=A0ABP6ZZS0_9ACTN
MSSGGSGRGIAGPRIEVRRSARRKRTVQAYRQGDAIVVLLPQGMSATDEERYVESMVERVLAREARRADAGNGGVLMERARRLSERYLLPQLGRAPLPATVSWVDNQQKRWGSCSTESGDIRLSDRLKRMPEWVQDYVLLHELVHLVAPDHGKRFRTLLSVYPREDRARGYLEGFQAGSGQSGFGDDAD